MPLRSLMTPRGTSISTHQLARLRADVVLKKEGNGTRALSPFFHDAGDDYDSNSNNNRRSNPSPNCFTKQHRDSGYGDHDAKEQSNQESNLSSPTPLSTKTGFSQFINPLAR
jgi:hypothetical protein